MTQKLTLKWPVILLTGAFFAAYAVYNIYIIVQDKAVLTSDTIFFGALTAFVFAGLAGLVWSAEVRNNRYLSVSLVRRMAFIVALIAIFVLKLRLAGEAVSYMKPGRTHNILYGSAYFLTLAAMLFLIVDYVFFYLNRKQFPKVSVILPIAAILLFLSSYVIELILFLGYGVRIEADSLRTAVIRPIYYLGLIGLSAYFLYKPRMPKIT